MASTPPAFAKTGRILAKVRMDRFGYGGSEDCITSIRCNGREFHIEMSPFFICSSPAVESHYRKFIAVVKGDYEYGDDMNEVGEGQEQQHPEEVLDEFHKWLIAALTPVFLEVVPDIPPSFDPDKLATGEAQPRLSEYLFPEQYSHRLEVENEEPFPIPIRDDEDCFSPVLNYIHPRFARELRQHVRFFDPSSIEVSFKRPEYALAEDPTRVLVDLDDLGLKTACFFKTLTRAHYLDLEHQLAAHLRVLKSTLPSDTRVVRLRGIVAVESRIAGLLFTHINHRSVNDGLLFEDQLLHTPIHLRQRWAAQIQDTVAQLHDVGLV
jgi:hypothetical protein